VIRKVRNRAIPVVNTNAMPDIEALDRGSFIWKSETAYNVQYFTYLQICVTLGRLAISSEHLADTYGHLQAASQVTAGSMQLSEYPPERRKGLVLAIEMPLGTKVIIQGHR